MIVKLPDFVIIGAQKAASTLLLRSLRQHPEAWMPAKEDPFFRDPVYDHDQLSNFAEKFAGRTERRLGFKCPDYLGRPEVPVRLHADLSEPSLIVCLRNPVQRALSAYFWKVRWGLIPVVPAEQGLSRVLDGDYRDIDPSVGDILDWGLYHQHLSRYLEYFPRHKLLILFDEDLYSDPESIMRQLHEFLGIAPDVMPTGLRVRQNPGIYSLERLRFGQRRSKHMSQWDAARTYHSIPYPKSRIKRAYTDVIAGIDRYLLSRRYPNDKPTLSPELSHRLWDFYAEDVKALQVLADRDLASWTPAGAGWRP